MASFPERFPDYRYWPRSEIDSSLWTIIGYRVASDIEILDLVMVLGSSGSRDLQELETIRQLIAEFCRE
jgi:hypothetical protein